MIDRLMFTRGGSYPHALMFAFFLLPAWCYAQAPPPYTISTAAGTCSSSGCTGGFAGDGGAATSAQLNGPAGLIFDSSGNLYIADANNNRVRKITGGTISTVAGNGTAGFSGDNGSATSAELNAPSGLGLDGSGNLFIADTANYEVRKVAGSTISTLAGKNSAGSGYSGDLGPASAAQLGNPSGVTVDSGGNVYLTDPQHNIVRVVCANQTPVACTNNVFGSVTFAAGDINTTAGNYLSGPGYAGDGGSVLGSLVNNPVGLTIDGSGNIYLADSGNNAIRKIDTHGIITTVAGNGVPGYSGDGGPAIQATLNFPKAVAVDSAGYIYIADTDNSVVRVVEPNGTITTIAGNHNPGFGGDNGPATSAELSFPAGIAVSGGKVYVSDTQNNVVRVLAPAPAVPAINAGGVITAGSFGASATAAPGTFIEIYGSNLAGNARTWGTSDFNGSTAPTSLDGTSVKIGGQSAFVDFISPGQINVQVPSGLAAGTQPLVLKTNFGTSATYNLTIGTAPGVFAPAILNIGGNQYVGALSSDSTNWILPTGAVASLTCKPAKAGDTILMYGVGFGSVTPDTPAGQIASGETTLTSTVQILFGTTPANIVYQGLVPGLVGLYQFNVVVPDVPAGSLVPVTFSQGGATLPQTLFTAVGS